MRPPIISTSRLTMERPRPEPPTSAVAAVRSCEKGSKMRGRKASLMPTPLSFTTNFSVTRFSPCSTQTAANSTLPPRGVNLTALDSRLRIISCSLRASARQQPLVASSSSSVNLICFSFMEGLTEVTTRLMKLRQSTGSSLSVTAPVSILLRSRVSLISCSRTSPDCLILTR